MEITNRTGLWIRGGNHSYAESGGIRRHSKAVTDLVGAMGDCQKRWSQILRTLTSEIRSVAGSEPTAKTAVIANVYTKTVELREQLQELKSIIDRHEEMGRVLLEFLIMPEVQ